MGEERSENVDGEKGDSMTEIAGGNGAVLSIPLSRRGRRRVLGFSWLTVMRGTGTDVSLRVRWCPGR